MKSSVLEPSKQKAEPGLSPASPEGTKPGFWHAVLNWTVLVAALGYFVDMYDLLLFGIVRVPSLKALGIHGDDQLRSVGVLMLNMQMIGMLVGGIIWGVLGDKKGRIAVLFGSILLYSIANIANAFVTTPHAYAAMRFLAGMGLAGELGAAITLVSEILPRETRGYGTTIVASVGILGSVTAALVGKCLAWNHAYMVGGLLGVILLVLRFKMFESGMYATLQSQSHVKRGDFLGLFTSGEKFAKYAKCILIGLPTWYVVGILITFSPEFGKKLGFTQPIVAGTSIMFTYLGLTVGDITSGFLSQYLHSRRRIVFACLGITSALVAVYLCLPMVNQSLAKPLPLPVFYGLCFLLGNGIGYWAVFVTIASEQFGTNMRSTVTTTVPNFVRGATVLITMSFQCLSERCGLGMLNAAWVVGVVTIAIALVSLYTMEETVDKDLNYIEE